MSEWRESTLGSFCSRVITGGTPDTKVSAYYQGGTIPWVKTKEVNYKSIVATESFITQDGLDNSSAKMIPINSIIVAMYGQGDTAGRVAINKIPVCTNQACCNLVIDKNKADYRFIYYVLSNSYNELVALKSGSAQPNLNTSLIKGLSIIAPDVEEQRAIAEILTSLDDKIDLLTRQNATLEALAQAYFRQWFVDCELITPLGDVFDFVNGFAFKSSTYETTGDYRIVTIKNVQDGEIDPNGAAYISEIPNGMNDKCNLAIGDVLISLTGNVGRVGIVSDNNLLLNQRVAKFLPCDSNLLSYFYFLFRQNEMKVYLESISKGTAQQNLSPVETLKTPIAFEKRSVSEYVKIATPIFEKIVSNMRQIRTLRKLRDALLPKLISGEVKVKEVMQ